VAPGRRVIARQQATLHDDAQQAPAYTRLRLGDGVGIDPGGGMEEDRAGGGGVEHAVDDDTAEVEMRVEGGTEAVDEDHRAEVRRAPGAGTVRAQALLHQPQVHRHRATAPEHHRICDRNAFVRSCFGWAKNSAGGPCSTITPPSVKYM